ncbi:MAG: SCO family protein [Gemmatimonadetes bacterium]|nr:SCO family protein [Gemmatimonadota bacterium]
MRASIATGLALSCGRADDGALRADGLRGTVVSPAIPRHEFTLTDTDGQPFAFARETAGQLTLLFFGYTNCPDICPVHMANLGQVLDRFPHDIRSRVRVVFVSTDPERDTPERIREWLDAMGPGFVGLRGPIEEVNRIQARFGLPPAARAGEGDAYAVGHAAQVIAFTPDDSARFAYPFGTRQADWLHDIPALLKFGGR